MEKSFITYNPYVNPFLDNSTLKGISYPRFSESKTIHGSGATSTTPTVVTDNSYKITTLEYDRLQQYIEKEVNHGQKDLIMA